LTSPEPSITKAFTPKHVRKTKKQREVLKELLITIVVVLTVYFLIEMGIPLRIIYENVNISIGAHYLGLLFGSLINALIICLSIHKK